MRETIRKGLLSLAVRFNEDDIENLSVYVAELMRWNTKINLTGIRDTRRAVRELLFDAFFVSKYVAGEHTVLDLGSGAAVLGIPISILNKENTVFSIDKSLRKIQFQRHIKRILRLSSFFPLHGRAEEIKPIGADHVVVKAFGTTNRILDIASAHVNNNGQALLIKGKKGQSAFHRDFYLENSMHYTLPEMNRPYTLFIYKKASS